MRYEFIAMLCVASLQAEPALVWSDEFDGTELDFTKWAVEENGHGGGNSELQYYLDLPKNVRVEHGHLVIEAHKEAINIAGVQKDYSSGRIRTKRRAAWTYGRFEIRAQLPKGRGLWPAIWLLPDSDRYGGWAASGEIDIVELVGHEPEKIHGTIHHGGSWPRNKHTGGTYSLTDGNFADDFHVFAIEWTADSIRWYVDETLYYEVNEWQSEGGPSPAPFNQPFHMIINLAVGGNWPGHPDYTAEFPAQLKVDYVRIYQ
ncbi:MAG: glycoside hydrolase family 16 protein [Opitutae bacterium]|jgi:beta-glucanase (GH16 family)|nr:glycoside hydrolase family 16 protein [Opitutae bacterium]